MSKDLKRNMLKPAIEAKSCMKVPSKKTTRLKYTGQNIFKLLTNPSNQNCTEFVMLNKKVIFEKLNRKVFDKVKDFGKQGFLFLSLNVLYLTFCKLYNMFNLIKYLIYIFLNL